MKKIINESTLKKIIAESLKEYLNEIGDTPAGFLAIKNAQEKAEKSGRYNQAEKFRDYAGMKDNYTLMRAGDDEIRWMAIDAKTRVSIESDGNITYFNNNNNNWDKIGNTSTEVDGYRLSRIKTDKKTARKIALWVSQHIPTAKEMYKDWHTWAAL